MNLLQEVVLSLNKEESRFFKLYAGRTNTKDERKDLILFDYIKKSDTINEDKISNKLYGKNKNAFYRLKNRLLTDLNKSLLLQHLNNEEDFSILQNILLSRVFRQKQKNKVAEVYLKKHYEEKVNQINELDRKLEQMKGVNSANEAQNNANSGVTG